VHFEIIGEIIDVEPIAVGTGVRIRKLLVKRFGRGRWRKLKGIGRVRLTDGTVRDAELPGLKRMESAEKRLDSSDSWIKYEPN
jgi:hypothetical protein